MQASPVDIHSQPLFEKIALKTEREYDYFPPGTCNCIDPVVKFSRWAVDSLLGTDYSSPKVNFTYFPNSQSEIRAVTYTQRDIQSRDVLTLYTAPDYFVGTELNSRLLGIQPGDNMCHNCKDHVPKLHKSSSSQDIHEHYRLDRNRNTTFIKTLFRTHKIDEKGKKHFSQYREAGHTFFGYPKIARITFPDGSYAENGGAKTMND